MSNNNETLKPGDRVRLTGWADPEPNQQTKEAFRKDGFSLPIECNVRYGAGTHGPDTKRIVCLTGWSVDWFTYEIITNEAKNTQEG